MTAKSEVVEEVLETAPEVEETEEVVEEVKPAAKGMKFYRSRLNGLTVVLGNHKANDPDEIERVRFVTRKEIYQGDTVKFGYLATDDKRAHAILANDLNVKEISEKEYNNK
jgi:hypothetical protein